MQKIGADSRSREVVLISHHLNQVSLPVLALKGQVLVIVEVLYRSFVPLPVLRADSGRM